MLALPDVAPLILDGSTGPGGRGTRTPPRWPRIGPNRPAESVPGRARHPALPGVARAFLLFGLGLDEFSMNAPAISAAKEVLRTLHTDEARDRCGHAGAGKRRRCAGAGALPDELSASHLLNSDHTLRQFRQDVSHPLHRNDRIEFAARSR